jgi:hypothetical protein
MDKEMVSYKKIVSAVAIAMLLLAIPSGIWPYGYYQILRWAVCGIAIFLVIIAQKLEMVGWLWIMIAIAILFNPIFPIYLDKGTWALIDLATAIILLLSIFKLKNRQ